jgi:hypothetical protein
MTKISTPVSLKRESAGTRISKLMTLLRSLPQDQASDQLFSEVCDWVTDLPVEHRPEALLAAVSTAFGRSAEELNVILKRVEKQVEFDALVPEKGWIHDYVEWTRMTEPPTVFHFFIGAVVIGAALARNLSFDKGAYEVFPNLCVMIIAPSGKCRKTSAANLGTRLYNKCGGTLLADKVTPEAFVDALRESVNATGLIYAPELSVFLGKQKYNEGMVPLLTALFDCPKEWTSRTLGRGETSLTNVALSALMCSTIDWIQTNIPKDAFGGGFMSRFLFVVQENTPRNFPLPPPLNDEVRKSLVKRLTGIRLRRGTFKFDESAERWYVAWYRSRASSYGDKQYAGYFERKPDHVIRLAMILKIAEMETNDKAYFLSDVDLERALHVLDWIEVRLPSTFDELIATAAGEDQNRILRHLKQAGGMMEHSTLLRRNSSKINAEQFKRSMTTLREAKLVDWNASTRSYILTPDGWDT